MLIHYATCDYLEEQGYQVDRDLPVISELNILPQRYSPESWPILSGCGMGNGSFPNMMVLGPLFYPVNFTGDGLGEGYDVQQGSGVEYGNSIGNGCGCGRNFISPTGDGHGSGDTNYGGNGFGFGTDR